MCLYLSHFNWYRIVQKNLFHNIEFLHQLLHALLELIRIAVILNFIPDCSISYLCNRVFYELGNICEIQLGFLRSNKIRPAVNHAFHTFHHIEVSSEVFSHLFLLHKLLILLLEVLYHLLVSATIDVNSLLLLSPNVCLFQVHLVQMFDKPIHIN